MERPNIFDALVTAEWDIEETCDEPGETSQAVEGYAADEPQSGEDETSDEEFLPRNLLVSHPMKRLQDRNQKKMKKRTGLSWRRIPPHTQQKAGPNGRKLRFRPRKQKNKNIFRPPPTQIPGTHHVHDPYGSSKLFVSDKMFNTTVLYTNLYGRSKFQNIWVECDSVEIEALFGLLLFLGVKKQNMLATNEIWDPIDGVNVVRVCMAVNRFKTLMSCLRFDDKSTRSARRARDAFAPIRDMWDNFSTNLSKHYIAGPLLTIDEQLVPFRGRCNFLQYLPSKPDRYGIKIFWVADSSNCFPLLGIPYLGRPLGQARQVNLGRNTALELAQPFFKSGRNITCDNYFTDLALAEGCLKNGLTVVGTVRTNKRFLPEPFKSKKGLPLHSSEFAYGTTATLVNYQGKKNKNTVVLSSMHDKGVVEAGAPKNKPEMILFYNSTKGAVDSLDEMAHTYTSKRITKRWPMVIMANVLDLATVAARCVLAIKFVDDSLAKKHARAAFIQNLSKQLMLPLMKRRLVHRHLSRNLTHSIQSSITKIEQSQAVNQPTSRAGRARQTESHPGTSGETSGALRRRQAESEPSTSAETASKSRKRARCAMCSWKADRKVKQRCQRCNAFICPDHMKAVCTVCFDGQ